MPDHFLRGVPCSLKRFSGFGSPDSEGNMLPARLHGMVRKNGRRLRRDYRDSGARLHGARFWKFRGVRRASDSSVNKGQVLTWTICRTHTKPTSHHLLRTFLFSHPSSLHPLIHFYLRPRRTETPNNRPIRPCAQAVDVLHKLWGPSISLSSQRHYYLFSYW